jgi:hypothetical protein
MANRRNSRLLPRSGIERGTAVACLALSLALLGAVAWRIADSRVAAGDMVSVGGPFNTMGPDDIARSPARATSDATAKWLRPYL